ncbi:EamA family transporter [Pontiella sp.]|uniref:EamA family transporter n=1 Tax=Pontiella sp. TaxID=2837462 RepID=UPI0035637880
MWVWLGLVSMLFLGVYDLCKKHSLNHNAVLPTLFFSNAASVLMVVPLILISAAAPSLLEGSLLYVAPMPLKWHGFMVIKALIVGASWICAYFALKHLPISIVSPIRASGPVWTLAGAILIFHEQPSPMQWAGMGIIFVCYFLFSLVGREEGIDFHRSRWVGLIFLATLIGTCSTLFDKWLLHAEGMQPVQVLAWYFVYLAVFFTLVNATLWWPTRKKTTPFQWRWTIPLIGILLACADFAYFVGVSDPDVLIVIMSVLRRCSILISFFVGAVLFKEVNKRKKAWVLGGIMVGVLLILLSGQ